jgi:competence protein ComEC
MFRVWLWLWGVWMAGSLVGFFVVESGQRIGILLIICAGITVLVRPAYWQLPVRVGLVLALCISCCYSAWTAHANTSKFHPSIDGKNLSFQGVITSQPMTDGNQITFRLRTAHDETVQMTIIADSKTVLAERAQLCRGQHLQGKGRWQLPMESGNVGLFDYRAWLNRQHVFWVVRVESGQFRVLKNRDNSFMSYGDQMRNKMVERLEGAYSDRFAGFLSGMLLGAREKVASADAESFSAIGLGHLLAISGLHVTVIVASWLWLMRKFKMMRVIRYGLTYVLLGLFVIVTGASVPVLRAAVMGSIGLWFAFQRRWRDALSMLALTGVLMLIWEPYWLLHVSYQLSFAVTFGLIAAVPSVVERMPASWPMWWRSALAVSGVAQVVSFPLTIIYFNELSLLSLPANIVFVPFVTFVITPLGYSSLLVPLAWLVEPMLRWLFVVVEWLNGFQSLRLVWATPSWWWVSAYAVVVGLMLYPHGRRGLNWGAGVVFIALLVYAYIPPVDERRAYMQAIDVGQGDAIVVRMPRGEYWLMDGGGIVDLSSSLDAWKKKTEPFEPGADIVLPLLMKKGVHRLDTIVMSHANEDHVLGLLAVIKRMPVRRILFNGTINGSKKIQALYAEALERGIMMQEVTAGDSFEYGPNAIVRVLNPTERATLFSDTNQNARSIVLHLRIYQTTLLLTGDLDEQMEPRVLQYAKKEHLLDEPLTILKVGHHGSRYSTSSPFLAMWRPQVAVISVGAMNRYGHPHPDTLRRLQRVNPTVYRTDRNGGICLEIINNNKVKVFSRR